MHECGFVLGGALPSAVSLHESSGCSTDVEKSAITAVAAGSFFLWAAGNVPTDPSQSH